MFYTSFVLLCLALQASCYVLLQVSKDDQNRSNVDALIHKVVPSDRFDRFAENLAKKQYEKEATVRQERGGERVQTDSSEQSTEEEGKTSEEHDKHKPFLRSSDFDIKPEVIHFRSNDKPTYMYEVDSKNIMKAIKEFLSSGLVKEYTDSIAKQAAAMFRSFNNDKINNQRTQY